MRARPEIRRRHQLASALPRAPSLHRVALAHSPGQACRERNLGRHRRHQPCRRQRFRGPGRHRRREVHRMQVALDTGDLRSVVKLKHLEQWQAPGQTGGSRMGDGGHMKPKKLVNARHSKHALLNAKGNSSVSKMSWRPANRRSQGAWDPTSTAMRRELAFKKCQIFSRKKRQHSVRGKRSR